MSTQPILELPVDIQLPAEAAGELNMRLLWIGRQLQKLSAETSSTQNAAAIGTRAERLHLASFDANNFKGLQFVETDTGLIYLSQPLASGSAGYVWKYSSGILRTAYSNPLASAAIFVKALGAFDANLVVYLTDKNRTLRWTGSAFQFAPWEVIPAGMIMGFRANPGTGWHLCDGATVTQLNADATTSSVTLVDLVTPGNESYPKWGAAADGAQPAVAPTLTMASYTPAGTIVSTFTGSPLAGHTHDSPVGKDVSSNLYALNIPTGGGTTYAALTKSTGAANTSNTQALLTSSNSAGTPAGSVASALTGTPATLTGTVSNTGEPKHYDLIPYQRI